MTTLAHFTVTPKLIECANTGDPVTALSNLGFDNPLVELIGRPELSEVATIAEAHSEELDLPQPWAFSPLHGDGDVSEHSDDMFNTQTLVFVVEGGADIELVVGGVEFIPLIPGTVFSFDHTVRHKLINEQNKKWSILVNSNWSGSMQ